MDTAMMSGMMTMIVMNTAMEIIGIMRGMSIAIDAVFAEGQTRTREAEKIASQKNNSCSSSVHFISGRLKT
jgi:hypothetical protein